MTRPGWYEGFHRFAREIVHRKSLKSIIQGACDFRIQEARHCK
ncbi:MAG: hypothetical protein ACTSUE_18230 [Promethearchaeota archaeon]